MNDLRKSLAAAATNCPPGVSFAKNIASLFNSTDVAHMKQVTHGSLDLSSYDSVKIWASQIYSQVSTGNMPPPPQQPWTSDQVSLFACWISQGCQP